MKTTVEGFPVQWGLGIAIAVAVFVILAGIGVISYRQVYDDRVCEQSLGQGASWAGGTDCQAPPTHVNGLL